MEHKSLLSLIRHLRYHLPPDKPVIVRRKPLKGFFGQSWHGNLCWYIIIDSRSTRAQQIDTLLHEWAHTLDNSPCREPHRDSWGKWYSRVYREHLTWENS